MQAATLLERFESVRRFSREISKPLSAEDCAIQSMPDVSPTRWHLAHTTWFFETFLLKQSDGYAPFDESFEYLFNSYYNTVGKQFPRERRGLISRPGLQQTLAYREHVDQAIAELIQSSRITNADGSVIEIGLQHEQQHQELMLTDIKHVLSSNPLQPAYKATGGEEENTEVTPISFVDIPEGVVSIGHQGDDFAFDNELPRHRQFVEPYSLANRCVTNGEYLEFIEQGGYACPEFWLSMGWSTIQQQQWFAPLYWQRIGSRWQQFTLAGLKPINLDEPVSHVSYFEADAFARWSKCRLPTEFEWEHAVATSMTTTELPLAGHWSDSLVSASRYVAPRLTKADVQVANFINAIGNLWEWTSSQYSAYPGYSPPSGALGEYNGKFMCNQFVLRGGSCATPAGHARVTYRNFFPPETRWQFSGIRLAR